MINKWEQYSLKEFIRNL